MNNTFWNPQDKRKSINTVLDKYCEKTIEKQKENEKIFQKQSYECLIRDKYGNLKKVSRIYYLYYIENDEYDTETELIDENDELEKIRILNKYS